MLEGLGYSIANATAMITGPSGWRPRLTYESLKHRELWDRGMGMGLGVVGLHTGCPVQKDASQSEAGFVCVCVCVCVCVFVCLLTIQVNYFNYTNRMLPINS